MRFGVIEYTTKSGHIWRPTPQRPNYLCDPEKEIDPTSFGSYTTAFNGEHIPLKGLIIGPVSQVKPLTAGIRRLYRKITGRWPRTYRLDYLHNFDVLLVVHQISDAHEIAAFAQRVKKELPHIIVLGVPTQPFGILKPYIEANQEARRHFVDYMNACDVFITVVKKTKQWYESLTTTPVEYVPQIYPTHYATRFFQPRSRKEKILFVAGVTDRPNIRKGQLVAKLLQRRFPEYEIAVTEIPGVTLDLTELKNARYRVQPFEQWRQHLAKLAKMMLVVNTDYTLTRGRVQTDCAAVGTPSLGANSDGQTDLFGDLASTPDTTVDELVHVGTRLLTDGAYYDQVVRTASERLKKYDFEESAARLMMLVKMYKGSNG